jgi:hypothetical protein
MRLRIVFVPGFLPFPGLRAQAFPAGVGVGVGLTFGAGEGFVGVLAGVFGTGFFSVGFLTIGFLVVLAQSIDRDFEHHSSIGKTATTHVLASKTVIDDVVEMQLAVIGIKALPSTSNGEDSRLETTLNSFVCLVGAAELVDRLGKPSFFGRRRDPGLIV